jgi:hypothetical protein
MSFDWAVFWQVLKDDAVYVALLFLVLALVGGKR